MDGAAPADGRGGKQYRLECYYCGGPHTQSMCSEKSKEVPKLVSGNKCAIRMLATVSVAQPVGAGMWACEGMDTAKRVGGESWISDSGVIERA